MLALTGVALFFSAVACVFPLFVDVAPGGESLVAGASDHDAADVLIGVGFYHCVVELGVHDVVHCIQYLGPVHCDDRHALFVLHQYAFVGHICYRPNLSTFFGRMGKNVLKSRIAPRFYG